jgi:hypothetical protein
MPRSAASLSDNADCVQRAGGCALQIASGGDQQSVEAWVNDGQEASDIGAIILP